MTDPPAGPTETGTASNDELLRRIAEATEATARSVATLRTIAMVGLYIMGGVIALYALIFMVSWQP